MYANRRILHEWIQVNQLNHASNIVDDYPLNRAPGLSCMLHKHLV
jgi:hypothetical protein